MSAESKINFAEKQLNVAVDKLITAKLAISDIPQGYKKDCSKLIKLTSHVERLINDINDYLA